MWVVEAQIYRQIDPLLRHKRNLPIVNPKIQSYDQMRIYSQSIPKPEGAERLCFFMY